MSCDNIQGNGHVAHAMITAYARRKDAELADWIERNVPFPNSMVDRITPRTTDEDREELEASTGIVDAWPVVCEPFTQWVLEDRFAAGRPPFEDVGVQVVDDVEPYELMKLRLLNASHQAIAYLGYLAGYRYAHEVAGDELFAGFTRAYMDREATPTLAPVPGVDLDDYKATLIERFANPEIRDTLARLAAESPTASRRGWCRSSGSIWQNDGEVERSPRSSPPGPATPRASTSRASRSRSSTPAAPSASARRPATDVPADEVFGDLARRRALHHRLRRGAALTARARRRKTLERYQSV